jgi:hypothetical protein
METCPKGYLEYLKSNPDYQDYCNSSNKKFLKVKLSKKTELNKWIDEQWIDVCSNLPCQKSSKTSRCKPLLLRTNNDYEYLCKKSRTIKQNASTIALDIGDKLFAQVVINGKTIALIDLNGVYYYVKPSIIIEKVHQYIIDHK